MSPFYATLRLELQRLLRGRWLPALWLAFLALSAYAAWNGANWTAARQGALAAILEDERATHAMRRTQIVEQVTPDNHGRYGGALYATAMSLRATLPPGPLALLTVGQAEGYPMAATVFPFVPSNTIYDRHTAGLENPAVLAAGRFDLAFVLVWLLPLLVLAGSFDLFASERERGMAPWLLSQPISPGQLLAAKAMARAILLALPLTAIPVAVVACAAWTSPGPLTPATLASLPALGGLVLLYTLFWLALALLVNLFARNAAQAALGCVAGWLVLVVLLPALALGVADLAAPPVSQSERVNVLRAKAMEARAEIRAQTEAEAKAKVQVQGQAGGGAKAGGNAKADAQAKACAVANADAGVKADPVAKAGVEAKSNASPEPVPAPNIPDSLRRRALEVERGEQLIQQAVRPFDAQDARRHAWLDALRAVSPAIALQDALERLAGADAARALSFQRQTHAFLLEVRVLVGEYLAQDRLLTAADYDRGLPRFSFREAPSIERAAILLADAALIGLAIAIALISVRRRLRHVSLTD